MRRSSFRLAQTVLSGAALTTLFFSVSARAESTTQGAGPLSSSDQAADLVHRARMAEADGKPEVRSENLQQALSVAPDYAPAHWEVGEIRSGDQWVSIDDAAKHDAHSEKLDEYRKLRDETAGTLDAQLKLARWCEKAGLKEQQRAHLMFALQLDPKCKEAIAKLDLIRYRGSLVSKAKLDDVKAKAKESLSESNEWKTTAYHWRQKLQDGTKSERAEVLRQIAEVRDPAAIGALEKELNNSGETAALAVIDALTAMPQQVATESLLRAAIFSQFSEVRHRAAYSLRSRSLYSYAPLLIAAFKAPIEVEYNVLNFDANNFTHQLRLSRAAADHEDVNIQYASSTFTSPVVRVGQGSVTSPVPPDSSAMRTMQTAAQQQQKVAAVVQNVKHINEQTVADNAVLADIMQTATDQQLGDDPQDWWNWWYDYNDYARPDDVNLTSNSSNYVSTNPRYQYSYTPSGYSRPECFVAGTSVWTTSGPMPIEQVKIGELVLSQDSETGELAYKPVLGKTIRQASPLVETHLGDTLIRSTRGHPFWVDGKGWQMAKELKAGQWLHTVHGPVQIDSAEPSDEAVCYNLIVADFHDYFVSAAKVLVHDNLLRGPTLATVPGLAEGN